MNEETDDEDSPLLSFLKWAVVLVVIVMVAYHFLMDVWLGTGAEDYGQRSGFGDQFNALGVAFTGVTLLLLVVSLRLQSKDLGKQTKAIQQQSESLELQQVALQQQIKEFSEQKEEMRRSAEAQEMTNRLRMAELETESLRLRVQVCAGQIAGGKNESNRQAAAKKAEGCIDQLERKLRLLLPSDEGTLDD